MISIFRNIRHKLFIEGKTHRYLAYAFGEIVIIIIGILIALQIGNWNENRKKAALEQQMLRELIVSLNHDLVDINYNIEVHTRMKKSQKIIIKWIESNQPYHDSLASHFSNINWFTNFVANTATFETLKSIGITTITNDSLRNRMLWLYDTKYEAYLFYENLLLNEIMNFWKKINPGLFNKTELLKITEQGIKPGKMPPLDPFKLKNDQEYSHYLKTIASTNDYFLYFITGVKLSIIELIEMLEKEIGKNEITDV